MQALRAAAWLVLACPAAPRTRASMALARSTSLMPAACAACDRSASSLRAPACFCLMWVWSGQNHSCCEEGSAESGGSQHCRWHPCWHQSHTGMLSPPSALPHFCNHHKHP